MPKMKLSVRRREEPAQVPELPSSWLQLQREKEQVKRWSWSWKRTRHFQRYGGRRCHNQGRENGDSGGRLREGRGQGKEDLKRRGSHPLPPGFSGYGHYSFPGPSIYEGNSRLLPDKYRLPPSLIQDQSPSYCFPTEMIWGVVGSPRGRFSPTKQEPCVRPSLLCGKGLWAYRQ